MPSSAELAAARVPAWKRLGLKLKQSSGPEPPTNETLSVGHPRSQSQSQSQSPAKRKLEAPPTADSPSVAKKPRNESQPADKKAQLKKKKSVTFGDTPTKNAPGAVPRPSDPKKPAKQPQPQKGKGAAKKPTSAPVADIKPALEYLRLWNSARDSWKFNKNHQSNLIKHVFDQDLIPAADVDVFYSYIRDLKGFVRTRLQETAMEVRKKDSMAGASGFPKGTVNLEDKQMAYDGVLAKLLHSQSGQKRKVFNEVQYRESSQDVDDIIRRVVKRMRAEMVLDQLSDSEDTDASGTTASSRTMSVGDSDTTKATEGDDKRVKLNDGSSKRRRKLRVNVDDDDSSSSSESESDSDTSSSGSSDDSDDDDEDGDGDAQKGHDSSSSSSSESSSDEEWGSDDETFDEDD